MNEPRTGIVYIVGAGPGDRKLITLKGVECLQRADVVIYDLLLNDALLEHCPAHTEKIQAPDPRIRATRQDELNHLLVQHARAGKIVVRLKGGDPYIFGRGGVRRRLRSPKQTFHLRSFRVSLLPLLHPLMPVSQSHIGTMPHQSLLLRGIPLHCVQTQISTGNSSLQQWIHLLSTWGLHIFARL